MTKFTDFVAGVQAASVADLMQQIRAAPIVSETRGTYRETYNAKRRDNRESENAKRSKRAKVAKQGRIAVLDMETDPFDNVSKEEIVPFLAVLYSDDFEPVVIWDEDVESFKSRVVSAIEALPGKYTIYAHSGGKFDFLFLIDRIRGRVSFKGRGIMSCMIGNHELRDSYHIIPEKLASMQKMEFDYENMRRGKRDEVRKEIIDYCVSDCENLLFYVKRFIEKFGFKISVGAAALATLRQHYEIEHVSEGTDEFLRQFFFGGRVECLSGKMHAVGDYKLYDINSAYPDAMCHKAHPVGAEYVRRAGMPNDQTCFVRLRCRNRGALMARLETGEVTTRVPYGEFHTTIWEYRTASDLGLISDVEIIECVDNAKWSNFSKFIEPAYHERQLLRERLAVLREGSPEWGETNAEQLFQKLLMNNAYGKTAQNPRKFKEFWITAPGVFPPPESCKIGQEGWECEYMGSAHWVWWRPAPSHRFLNVGTGASITGAVRAKLMHAIYHARDPIYCDTDSVICREMDGVEFHKTNLGAWDLEKEISEIIICGKKLYAYRTTGGKEVIRSKGVTGLTWVDLEKIYGEETVTTVNFAPSLTKYGTQSYLERRVRATVATHGA